MNRLSDAPVRAERGTRGLSGYASHRRDRGGRDDPRRRQGMAQHGHAHRAMARAELFQLDLPLRHADFVMISGALFLDERREVRLRRLFSKTSCAS